MRDVRKLVILDWLLTGTGDRWRKNADHLSEVDRAQARAILESQRTALREGLRRAIQEAYGAARETPGTLAEDTSQDEVLVSLDAGFVPAAPVGADLGAAFRNLVDQAFGSTYPAHPRFEPGDTEVTVRDLQAVYAHVERAVADPEGRVRLEGDVADRPARRQRARRGLRGGDALPVRRRQVRAVGRRVRARRRPRRRPPGGHGHRRAGAEVDRRDDSRRTGCGTRSPTSSSSRGRRCGPGRGTSGAAPVPPPRPGSARPEMELRPEPLPAPADWKKAASRAEALFGLHVNPYLTAAGVAELAADIQQTIDNLADSASGLVPQIEHAYQRLGLEAGQPGRLATARAGRDLLDALRRAGQDRVRLIETLASAQLPGTEAALANSLTRAGAVADALRTFRWDRLTPLREAEATADDRGRSAASALSALREAVRADEFASRISPAPERRRGSPLRVAHRRPGTGARPRAGSCRSGPYARPGQASSHTYPVQGHRDTGASARRTLRYSSR